MSILGLLLLSFGIAGIAYAFMRLWRPALCVFAVLLVLDLLTHHVYIV